MKITIESPDGPRQGAIPMGGIHEEAGLVKALLITLACECARGHGKAVFSISLDDINPEALIAIARSVGRTEERASSPPRGLALQLALPVDHETELPGRLRDRV